MGNAVSNRSAPSLLPMLCLLLSQTAMPEDVGGECYGLRVIRWSRTAVNSREFRWSLRSPTSVVVDASYAQGP
jgi:hypothetical protein